jgi:hypothetical protein
VAVAYPVGDDAAAWAEQRRLDLAAVRGDPSNGAEADEARLAESAAELTHAEPIARGAIQGLERPSTIV